MLTTRERELPDPFLSELREELADAEHVLRSATGMMRSRAAFYRDGKEPRTARHFDYAADSLDRAVHGLTEARVLLASICGHPL
jgi:hypothetical protein